MHARSGQSAPVATATALALQPALASAWEVQDTVSAAWTPWLAVAMSAVMMVTVLMMLRGRGTAVTAGVDWAALERQLQRGGTEEGVGTEGREGGVTEEGDNRGESMAAAMGSWAAAPRRHLNIITSMMKFRK